ncbi:hypothetical protein P2318_17275 [Myxococcaceae bacterium GXIMD 01537]
MSFFGFDDNGNGGGGAIDLSAADDKTLRLAMPPFSEEEFAGLLRFQRTYLARAEGSSGPEALATAHREALEASGLAPLRVEQGLALLRLFGGKCWTVERLRTRLGELRDAGPEREELRLRIQSEMDRLERETDTLVRRFGPETMARLRQHEPELLALHTRLTEVLRRG